MLRIATYIHVGAASSREEALPTVHCGEKIAAGCCSYGGNNEISTQSEYCPPKTDCL